MSTKTFNDPLSDAADAAEAAWLEYARGTWSETDRRIFIEGFRQGWWAQYKHLASVKANETTETRRIK